MGRTNPTYRDFLERYERKFSDVRRALRRQHQEDFDVLFDGARQFADATGYANHLDRDTLVLLSMLLSHQAELREREQTIDELADEVETLRAAMSEREFR